MNDPKQRSPFAKLAALREQLPAGEAPAPKTEAPPASTLFAGRLVVRREKKGRGGKTVTAVVGLKGTLEEREALALDLRKALGCGGTLDEETPGEPVVILQGDLVARCSEWLTARGARDVRRGN